MEQRRLECVQVVYKKSAYDIHVQKHKDPVILSLIEANDPSIQWMLQAHEENQQALQLVREKLKARGVKVRLSYRAKKECWDSADLVLAVGGDGTLLEAARMIRDRTPLMGLHSTPTASVGYLCAAHVRQIDTMLDAYMENRLPAYTVPRIQVRCNGEPIGPPALNDVLLASPSPAATLACHLQWNEQEEHQRSSGIWLATGVGSTAAILSAGGQVQAMESQELQFVVREPYHTSQHPLQCLKGLIQSNDTFSLTSRLRKAYLFFDGPWVKHPISYNDRLTFALDAPPLQLLASRRGQSDEH
ncbi:MAG: hypothetical protein EP343_00260 [Deltaproteobacteria bacterium]|nr:MAG: hypothetical protein EP343_00260 [Deltaproteobacteria bacterium]